jgi:hypothetical protein
LILIHAANGAWWMQVSQLYVPVQRGLRLRLDGRAVTYKDGKPKNPPQFLQCEVVSWEYQIAGTDTDEASLDVVVDEVRPAKPISDNWAMAALGLGGVTCLVLWIQLQAFYYHPDEMWAFFGRNARPLGVIAIVILFMGVFPSRMGLRKRTRFRELFLTAILCWTGIALGFLWWSFTRHPDPFPGDTEFGHLIALKMKADNWPLLIAALPWAAVVFKLLGVEIAEKTTNVVIEVAKKKD